MLLDQASSQDKVGATITRTVNSAEKVAAGGVFTVTCLDANVQVKWEENLKNLLLTAAVSVAIPVSDFVCVELASANPH